MGKAHMVYKWKFHAEMVEKLEIDAKFVTKQKQEQGSPSSNIN